MVAQVSTPDIILGRAENKGFLLSKYFFIDSSEKGFYNQITLPLKRKHKPNGHKEKRGR